LLLRFFSPFATPRSALCRSAGGASQVSPAREGWELWPEERPSAAGAALLGNLQEAVAAQTISRGKAATMRYIGNVLLSCLRDARAIQFRNGAGPNWDAIRKLLDDRDAHMVTGS
jgi:hypothetical protein